MKERVYRQYDELADEIPLNIRLGLFASGSVAKFFSAIAVHELVAGRAGTAMGPAFLATVLGVPAAIPSILRLLATAEDYYQKSQFRHYNEEGIKARLRRLEANQTS